MSHGLLNRLNMDYGVRSPKFIWAPAYSCTHCLRPRNPHPLHPCIWAHIRGQLVSQDRPHLFPDPLLSSHFCEVIHCQWTHEEISMHLSHRRSRSVHYPIEGRVHPQSVQLHTVQLQNDQLPKKGVGLGGGGG
jgi:hypothetical protein